MFLFLTIITILILLVINIFAYNKNLLSPPVIVCAVFLFSALCSAYNYQYWEFQIHENTFLTIAYGLTLFSAFSFITEMIYKRIHPKVIRSSNTELKVIKINNIKIFVFIGLSVAISVWYAIEIIRIAGRYGYVSSLSDVTYIYRSVASYGVLSVEDDVNFMCKQLYKLVPAMSYVSIYIFFNNIIASGKIKGQLHFLIPCIVYLGFSFISAGRYQMIKILSAAIFMYYILYFKHNNNKTNGFEIKFLIKCFLAFVVFCGLFVLTREIVGRKTDKDPIYYITSYAGGSIPLLDSFLQYPPVKSDIWGKETFYSLNTFIGRYFNVDRLQYITHHEFRSAPTGQNMGNVYTVFRRMLFDFGYGGMTILYSFCAVFYTLAYNRIRSKPASEKIDLRIIFYSYISFGLTMQFYEESFYTNILSVGTAVTFFLIYLCKVFLLNITWNKQDISRQKIKIPG